MENSKPRYRIQFSLLWLAAIITIAALAVSNWQKSKDLAAANAELYRLRNELGYLAVADKTQFHAIAIDADEKNTWRWRVFIPEGNKYYWQIAVDGPPKDSQPDRMTWSSASNQDYSKTDIEVLVTARLRENDDGTWTLAVTSNIVGSDRQMGGAAMKNIPAEKLAWLKNTFRVQEDVMGSKGTEAVSPKGRIMLLEKRNFELTPDGMPSGNPQPGFLIWLESRD